MAVQFFIDVDKILQSRKMTLTELSDKTGIRIENLSRMKRTKTITLATLNKLASGLGETDPTKLMSVTVKEN